MSIFARMADIINANITAMLDKAEDPRKMIRMIVQEMEDSLVSLRTESARMLASQKTLQRRMSHLQQQVDDWQGKAELAVTRSRDDLARAALVEKSKVQKQLDVLVDEHDLLKTSIAQLGEQIGKLEAKLAETRQRQQTMQLRYSAAQKRATASAQFDEGRLARNLAEVEKFEQRIDHLEAKAQAFDSQAPKLDQEFAQLLADEAVEDELAKLKAAKKKQK